MGNVDKTTKIGCGLMGLGCLWMLVIMVAIVIFLVVAVLV